MSDENAAEQAYRDATGDLTDAVILFLETGEQAGRTPFQLQAEFMAAFAAAAEKAAG